MSPCLCNIYAGYIIRNAGLDDSQARIKIASRNINNLRYADDTTLMADGEGNGTPLQYSCLENPMDGGAWWAAVHFHFSLARIGEGNGNPLQCSCLEKPRDGGAWWAAIYGVAQSPTRLKQLSSSSSEEELNSLLMKVKEESEKAGLKFNIQKTKVMASSHITTWQIDREKVETVSDFIVLGSKITVDGDCSHKIKRCLFLERKAMANLNSVLKSRDITLLTKVHNIVKAMVSPVVTYGCESWTIKKAEHRRTDAFELWCWRRLLGVPWTTRSSN